MPRKKKSNYEIFAAMLEAARQGATLRGLRDGKGNDHAKRYASSLVASGMLKYEKGVYRTTAKGRKFLALYMVIQI